MRAARRWLARFAASVTRRDEARLKEEIEEHLALQTAENIRSGLPPAEARRQAVLKFGAVEAIKERYRDEQRVPLLEHLTREVRYALRQLRRSPLFTVTATLSLAAGIGANAAIFTLIDRVLLRDLPVTAPGELFFVTDQRSLRETGPRFSYPFYAGIRDNAVLDGLAAHYILPLNAIVDGRATRVHGELVSGNYFTVVGVGARLGRALTPADDRAPGAHAVAVISDRFWRRSFAADPSVLGRTVRLNDYVFTIVGVAARAFTGTEIGTPTDVWLPLMMQREAGRDLLTDASTNWLEMIGRLRAGGAANQAGTALTTYVEHLPAGAQVPFRGRRFMLLPAGKGSTPGRGPLGTALRVLMVLAVLALALACVNVAALLVERSSSREKEIAVRLSLGAGRASLVRQCLTETLLLAAIGGAAGLIVAPWAADVLTTAQPGVLEIDTSLDVRVFLFGLAAAGLSGLLVGLAPILASNRIGLADVARHVGGTAAGGRRRPTLHDLVVTCQLAISLIMLIGAALLVQSVRNFSSADPGFRAEDVLLAGAHPATAGYDGARLDTFWRETLDRVGRVRGVQSASLARLVPLAPGGQRQRLINPASGEAIEIDTNAIAPAYFRTLAIPLLEGRDFSERDGQGSTRVMIVNERMARMFWPGQDPVGKRIRLGRTNGPVCEVIAVAKDVKYRRLGDEPAPMLYIPIYQSRSSDPMTLHIRSSGDARDLVPAIRREMQALDANVPIFEMRTLADQLNASFAQTRQAAALTSAFGMLALLLSGIGVYGVTALAVGRRTRDIGIRRALGARPRHIASVVSRRGLVLVVVGVGLGVLGGIAFTPLAASLLYGVAAGDRATFAVMSALLAAVSLIAIGIPARAAARLDPAAAIRHE